MTDTTSIDPARLLEEGLAQASPDLLRELLGTVINALLSAEADAVCGAVYGTVTPERVNRRHGYRHRDFDTRAGAAWQRCRTHYAANLMPATPKSSWGWVKALLHSIYDQPDAASVHAQFDRVVDAGSPTSTPS